MEREGKRDRGREGQREGGTEGGRDREREEGRDVGRRDCVTITFGRDPVFPSLLGWVVPVSN